jgi:transposase-like protein
VSRTFVAQTEAQLAEFLQRPLDGEDLPVVMIDGLHIDDHVLLGALGITRRGFKQVLGLWDGTTESEATCRSLLSELVGRGLVVEQARLFVIDGGKGLRKAIRKVFGEWALIARCRVHKMRNVADHLPKDKQAWVRSQMRRAFSSSSNDGAKQRLLQLATSLEESYPSAASSLREGLDETLTILRLNVGPALTATLCSTNPIENLNGSIRNLTRRVKRWRGGRMAMRWAASSLLEAEQKFRRVKGYREMPGLLLSLKALYLSSQDNALDIEEKVA